MQPSKERQLGLYLHIPFCLQKCAYCDFPSYAGKENQMETYTNAMLQEINAWHDRAGGLLVDTIFVGGGTPTALPPKLLCRILEAVTQTFPLASNCEWTVECNPKTADRSYFKALKTCGVNRISLGAQSFVDSELRTLGRIHNTADIKKAVWDIRDTGIKALNLDLMYGFFGQTPASFQSTLERAIALEPEHLSVYSLILEEGTPFFERDRTSLPSEEAESQMDRLKEQFLAQAGYLRYEISNYAKPEKECRHNLKYWQMDEYLGLGASAHSYFDGKRFFHPTGLFDYLQNPTGYLEEEILSPRDEMGEYMMLGLRLTGGVSFSDFGQRFGVSLEETYGAAIRSHEKNGLLQTEQGRLFLTKRGLRLANYVMCDFL